MPQVISKKSLVEKKLTVQGVALKILFSYKSQQDIEGHWSTIVKIIPMRVRLAPEVQIFVFRYIRLIFQIHDF